MSSPGFVVESDQLSDTTDPKQRNIRKRSLQMTLSPQQSEHPSASAAGGDATDDDYDTAPVLECIYCKICKRVLAYDNFYPSCLKRKVHHCKGCQQDKQTQRRRNLAGGEPHQKLEKDEATYMFERFRRRCARQRTSRIEDDRSAAAVVEHGYEPGALSEELDLISETSMTKLQVAFNVKATRQLLKFWNHSSALSKTAHIVIPNGDVEPGYDAAEVDCSKPTKRRRMTKAVLADEQNVEASHGCLPLNPTKSQNLIAKKKSKTPLTLILWDKIRGTESVQPWEVIPVTHAEAVDFRNTPSHIRPKLIAPQWAAALAEKLNQLRLLLV